MRLLTIAAFFIVMQVQADTSSMMDTFLSVKSNPTTRMTAIQAGEDRATLCGYCHGKNGNSVKSGVPNLAGQNAEYLFQQFSLFADGTRKNYVMERLAKVVTPEDQINLALYYGSLPVLPQANVHSSVRGKEIYQGFCFACHGENGLGSAKLPRVAGQKRDFIIKALTAFKEGDVHRNKSPMVAIMEKVNREDIEPLADYLASLNHP